MRHLGKRNWRSTHVWCSWAPSDAKHQTAPSLPSQGGCDAADLSGWARSRISACGCLLRKVDWKKINNQFLLSNNEQRRTWVVLGIAAERGVSIPSAATAAPCVADGPPTACPPPPSGLPRAPGIRKHRRGPRINSLPRSFVQCLQNLSSSRSHTAGTQPRRARFVISASPWARAASFCQGKKHLKGG